MESIESKILNFLEGVDFGASAVEISKKIDVSRPTVLKYLEVMKVKGLVDYKEIGMAKLWHSHKPHLLELLEKEKEKAEHRLKAILDVIGDGVAILDKDMKFVWIDKIYKKRIKNQRGDLPKVKGNSCHNVFQKKGERYPDYYVVTRALKTGKVEISGGEFKSVLDGKKHYYEVQGSPIKDNDGNTVGVLLLRRSLTERKKLENALKASEEKYMEVFNNINIAIYRTTPGKRGNIMDCNPALSKILGYESKEELLKVPVCDLYENPEDRKKWNEKMLKQGFLRNHEMQLKRKDGSLIWVLDTAVAVKDETGKVKYYDGFIEDITEKKKLEEALRESEERYLDIANNINVGIYRTTPGRKGKHIDVNPAYIKMFDFKNKEEVLNTDVCDTYEDPKEREKFDKLMKEHGYVENLVSWYKRKDGSTLWTRETAVAVRDEKGNIKYYDGIVEDITERKKLEEALKESEERYRSMVENNPIGVYRTLPGKEGGWIEANPAIVKMYGYGSKEELLKVPVRDLYKNPKDREKLNERVKKYGFVEGAEFEYKRKDGSTFWGRISDRAVYDEKGNVKYYDGIIEDITEKKKLEEALKESEERYRSIFENVHAGVNRVTPGKKGRYIDVNPAYLDMLGYESKEELFKVDICDMYQNPKDREKYSEKMLDQGYVRNEILRLKKKDGTPFLARENAVVVYDKNGKVKYFDCITEDITEKNKLEKALKESEEKYRTIVENANDGIFVVNDKGNYVEVNKKACEMLGYTKEELLKLNIRDLVPSKDLEKALKRFSRVKKGENFVKEINLVKKDGSIITVEQSYAHIQIGGKTLYQGIARDITEKKKLEEALKESEEKYREIFGNIEVGVYRATPGKKGKLIDANPTFVKIFGYNSKEELREVNVCDLYKNPKDREEFDQKMKKQGYLKDRVLRMRKKDGTPFWTQETSVVVYDENGKVKYYDGVIEDITNRWKGLESVGDATYISTKEGKLLYMNQSGVELFGYEDREEFLSIVSAEDLYVNSEDRWRFQKEIEKKGGFVKDFKTNLKRKDGSKFLALITANVRRDERGRVVGYEGIIREIK